MAIPYFKNLPISTTLRLINFLLDSVIYFGLLVLGIFIFQDLIPVEQIKFISAILYVLYYFLFEYFLGQTLGKMLTQSKVVPAETDDFLFVRIFVRSIVRVIPLDIFSYLITSRGLHDRISFTKLEKV